MKKLNPQFRQPKKKKRLSSCCASLIKYHATNKQQEVEVLLHPTWPRHKMEVSVHVHAPAFILEKSPLYQLGSRLGGLQSMPGRCDLEKTVLPVPGK
jgi:hypothetical protein